MPKATVTIQAAAEHPDVLDIRDAMQQVLDFFELLTGDDDRATIAWNITYAGTNSPFTAEAEAVSVQKDIDIRPIANLRISEVAEYLNDLSSGRRSTRPISLRRRKAAKKVFERNTRSIGKTIVRFDLPKASTVTLTPINSLAALGVAEVIEGAGIYYLPEKRERQEFGSVEGTIVDVRDDYNQPAIRIVERKSGKEISCRVDQDVIDEIANSTSLRDVWEHRRVRVRGMIIFDSDGQIKRIYAKSVSAVFPRSMTTKDIEDKNFTGGLGINEYLEKLREGELG
jgi:hypothetical protein